MGATPVKPGFPHTLRHFSALTGVRELEIDYLDIPNFMPQILRYFEHFSPTVRSLVLRGPKGSHRQIIYFIGLFQHLQDLRLIDSRAGFLGESADDPMLIPLFVPPLRGSLTVRSFATKGLLKVMINLFGGIRFRFMYLLHVNGIPTLTLLNACTKSLECLMLYPPGSSGEQLSLKVVRVLTNDFTGGYSLLDLDLSQHKYEYVLASSLDRTPTNGCPDTTTFLKHVLSTIPPSTSLDATVTYADYDLPGRSSHSFWPQLSQVVRVEETTQHHRLFEVLHEVHKVRSFRLTLYASVFGCRGETLVRRLEEAVAEEDLKGGFDESFCKPLWSIIRGGCTIGINLGASYLLIAFTAL